MTEQHVNGDLRKQVQELMTDVAVLESRLEAAKDALRLQAIEYERRLDQLNHAHQEAKDVQKTYLTIDRFDRFFDDFTIWRRTIDGRLTEIRASTMRYAGILAAAFALITLALQIWRGVSPS